MLHATGATGALLFIDRRAGGRRGEVDLDVGSSGPLARLGGGLVVAGRSGGAGVLVLADPRRGRAWEVEVPLAGALRLTPAGRALALAGDDAGGLALLDAAGRLRWSLPSDGSEGGAAPVVSRRLAAAARGGLSLADLGGGEAVARAPDLSPHRLAADAGLGLTVLEADGAVTRLQPTGHLSVLGSAGLRPRPRRGFFGGGVGPRCRLFLNGGVRAPRPRPASGSSGVGPRWALPNGGGEAPPATHTPRNSRLPKFSWRSASRFVAAESRRRTRRAGTRRRALRVVDDVAGRGS